MRKHAKTCEKMTWWHTTSQCKTIHAYSPVCIFRLANASQVWAWNLYEPRFEVLNFPQRHAYNSKVWRFLVCESAVSQQPNFSLQKRHWNPFFPFTAKGADVGPAWTTGTGFDPVLIFGFKSIWEAASEDNDWFRPRTAEILDMPLSWILAALAKSAKPEVISCMSTACWMFLASSSDSTFGCGSSNSRWAAIFAVFSWKAASRSASSSLISVRHDSESISSSLATSWIPWDKSMPHCKESDIEFISLWKLAIHCADPLGKVVVLFQFQNKTLCFPLFSWEKAFGCFLLANTQKAPTFFSICSKIPAVMGSGTFRSSPVCAACTRRETAVSGVREPL